MSKPIGRARLRAPSHRPRLVAFFAAAMIGRLSYATVCFALLLLLKHATGSYSVAGGALVAYGLTAALVAPLRARFVDRRGRRRGLAPLALSTAFILIAIGLLAEPLGSTPVALIGLTGLAGCLLPPLGPVTRNVWAEVASSPDGLRRAYSLDIIAEEALFTVGPLLVSLVVTLADARAAVLLSALTLVLGTAGMVSSPLICVAQRGQSPEASGTGVPSLSPLRHAPFRSLLVVLLGVGIGLGGMELATVAFAERADSPASSGVLLAVLSLGSAVGGMAYGIRAWRRGAAAHIVMLSAFLAVALILLAFSAEIPGVLPFGAAMFLTGLCIAPLLVVAYTRADELSDSGNRMRASTFVNTVNNLGTAMGAGTTGLVLDHLSPSDALLAGGLVMTATALVARFTAVRSRAEVPQAA